VRPIVPYWRCGSSASAAPPSPGRQPDLAGLLEPDLPGLYCDQSGWEERSTNNAQLQIELILAVALRARFPKSVMTDGEFSVRLEDCSREYAMSRQCSRRGVTAMTRLVGVASVALVLAGAGACSATPTSVDSSPSGDGSTSTASASDPDLTPSQRSRSAPDDPISAAATKAKRSLAARPTITVTLGRSLSVAAPGVRAGWANMEVTRGWAVVARFAGDYDFDAFSADYESFQSDPGGKGKEALERILDRTKFLGGVAQGNSGSIKLPRPGTYTVMALNTYTGIKSATFRAGRRLLATRDRPSTRGTIHALDGQEWGGPATLPHEGRLLLTNHGGEVPHNLILQRVKEGTTAADYQEWMYANDPGPHPNLNGSLETQMLSPGTRMTVDYRLPRGQYAVMCFETDPSSGMSHVFQGELRMIHLK
jgi:hypothetical protein